MVNIGHAHSDLLIFLRMPCLHNLSTSSAFVPGNVELGRLLHGMVCSWNLSRLCLLDLFSRFQLYHQRGLHTSEVELTAFVAPPYLAACILEQSVLSQLYNTMHLELLEFFLHQL